ncbi:MAG: S8 family serine peptidase [Sulfurimonas sp.]
MTQILLFISLLFFIGCGGESSSSNSIADTNNTASQEPYYYQQWYLDKNETFYAQNGIDANANIHPDNLLNVYSGKKVKIAVIDDGLDVTHEDLEGAIIHTYDSQTKSTDVSQTNQADNHGTAVTGIIGARVNKKGIKGIASSSEIIFLKYKESMSDSETMELFSKAAEFGADIINCSWGTYDVSDAVKAKIQDLSINGRNGKGIVVVFASGNDDKDMGNDESAIPEVIAVGATEKDNLRAWYSNYGTNLDIVSPGGYDVGITTLDEMGSRGMASLDENYILYNDFNSFIGTSASAPIVSGVIALMLEKNPNLTRVQIDNILKSTSDKIGKLSYDGDRRNDYYGYGKINLAKIISSIQ